MVFLRFTVGTKVKQNVQYLEDVAPTQVSELYPNIEYEEQIVDNTCQQLVINPQQFDVMVCFPSNFV